MHTIHDLKKDAKRIIAESLADRDPQPKKLNPGSDNMASGSATYTGQYI